MRFLVWIIFTTGYTAYHISKEALRFYEDRNLPAYLIDKSELAAVIVLGPLDAFVFIAVLLLFLKCSIHILRGNTQIEEWERDRISSQCHTERFWLKIRNNYKLVHGKELPKLTSWNLTAVQYRELEQESEREEIELTSSQDGEGDSIVPKLFTPDDVIFPYDLGIFRNIYCNMGNPLFWIFPWSGAPGNGYEFETETDGDQLNLPWPPDGGNVDFPSRKLTDEELRSLGNVELIKKHLDPRGTAKRESWTNDEGEGLADYGVDVSAEEEKGIKL